MKVKELMEILKECDPELEIKVLIPLPNRPSGGRLEPIHSIEVAFDQDTYKPGYIMDIGEGQSVRWEQYLKEKKKSTDLD